MANVVKKNSIASELALSRSEPVAIDESCRFGLVDLRQAAVDEQLDAGDVATVVRCKAAKPILHNRASLDREN
jgi:hypothetical protein